MYNIRSVKNLVNTIGTVYMCMYVSIGFADCNALQLPNKEYII